MKLTLKTKMVNKVLRQHGATEQMVFNDKDAKLLVETVLDEPFSAWEFEVNFHRILDPFDLSFFRQPQEIASWKRLLKEGTP